MNPAEFRKIKKYFPAQSLVEILVGLAVVGVVFVSAAELIFVSLKTARLSREKSLAQSLVNDMASSVKSIINYDWHDLWSTSGGQGYWHFDDGAGSLNSNDIAIDEIYGNHGTLSLGSLGNTSLASAWMSSDNCKLGQCLSLDGVDDYLSMGYGPSLELSGDLTISFWTYPTSLSPYASLLRKGDDNDEFFLRTSSGGGLSYLHGNGVSSMACTIPSIFSQDIWTHVVLVRDVSEQSIMVYKNGAPQGVSCGSWVSVATSSSDMAFGYFFEDYDYYSGRLDELRLYDAVLDSGQIGYLFSDFDKFYPQNNAGIWDIFHGQETVSLGGIDFSRYFSINLVQRDGSGDIISSGGDNDPLTKKISLSVNWFGGQVNQEEYVSRTHAGGVFYQTDWSGGAANLETVFLTPRNFNTASSTIVYSSSSLSVASVSSFGTLDSMVFDSQNEQGISPASLIWQGELGPGNSVQFRLAVSNSSSGPWNFIGADGTGSSYFPMSGSSQANTQMELLLPEFYNQRYLRYQILLTYGDVDNPPRVDDIGIYWSR